MIRYIGLDLHKKFVQACFLDADGKILQEIRVETRLEDLQRFIEGLGPDDQVAFESCTFAWTMFDLIAPKVARVVVANAFKVRAIAEAKVKTDKVDARILAELLRADYLPGVWTPDTETRSVRSMVAHRHTLVRRIVSLKNSIHALFHRRFLNCPMSDLFGKKGRFWMTANEHHLPDDERRQLHSLLRILDCVMTEREEVESEMAALAFRDEEARLLMTIPGFDYPVALAVLAAVGDVRRFSSPEKLGAYLGLVPSIRQSGEREFYGRITKHGNAAARWLLVQAAHQLTRLCTPLRPFYERIKRRRGRQTAVVALARKLATLVWHVLTHKQPYRYANARSVDKKFGRLQIKATGERRKSGPKPGGGGDRCKENTIHLPGGATFSRTLEQVHQEWNLPPLTPLPQGELRHLDSLGGIEQFLVIR